MIKTAINEASAHDWNNKLHSSNTTVDTERLLASLQEKIIINMDTQVCTEVMAGLSAYYKVGLNLLQESCLMLIDTGGFENIR